MASKQTKTVKVCFEDGDSLVTRINGTTEQIEQYYLNHTFNLGTSNDNLKKCVKIEFMEDK